MRIAHAIFLITMILWIFPLFKQKGTEYFSVFFIMAISDPIRILVYNYFNVYANSYFPIFSLGILVLLVPQSYKIILGTVGLISIILLNVVHLPRSIYYLETSSVHLVIALIICYRFFDTLRVKKAANLFLMLFISSEFMTVYKLLPLALLTERGTASFNLGTFFQFSLAIAFAFVNINTKNFPLKFLMRDKQIS